MPVKGALVYGMWRNPLALIFLKLLREIAEEGIDLFLMWHKREQEDPAHHWFRQRIIDSMKSISQRVVFPP